MTINYQIQDYDAPYEHHPVDDIEPIEAPRSELAESLVRLVVWQINATSVNSIAARTIVLSQCLLLGEKSLSWAEIAEYTGMTRAAIQLMAKELEDQFLIRSHNSRTDQTRERCRIAQHEFRNTKS